MLTLAMNRIEATSMVVSIVVIFFLTLAFGILFYLYYRYYRKCVDGSLEDSYIKKEVIKENPRYFRHVDEVVQDENMTLEEKYEAIPALEEHVKGVMKRKNGLKVLANTVLVIVYLLCLSVLAFAAYSRASGETFLFGDTTCLIIRTGSMEEDNKSNSYLVENNLTEDIPAMALVGLDKVSSPEDMELYGIYAFQGEDRILVHRLISIQETEEGDLYTFRGDANSASLVEEVDVPFEKIVGVYNGFQNVGLGMTIGYLQSDIGIIAVCFGLVLVGCYDIFEISLGKRIEARKKILYPIIDGETKHHVMEGHRQLVKRLLSEEKAPIEEPKE